MALAAEAQAVATAMFGPRKPELDRDVARRRRWRISFGNDERADAAGAALDQVRVLLFEFVRGRRCRCR